MRVSCVFHLYMYLHLSLPTILCVLWPSQKLVISCIINWTKPQLWLAKCWLINRLLAACGFVLFLIRWDSTCCSLSGVSFFLRPLEIESQFHIIRTKRGNTNLKTSDRSSGRFPKWLRLSRVLEREDCVCVSTHTHSHRQQAPTCQTVVPCIHLQQADNREVRSHKTQW